MQKSSTSSDVLFKCLATIPGPARRDSFLEPKDATMRASERNVIGILVRELRQISAETYLQDEWVNALRVGAICIAGEYNI